MDGKYTHGEAKGGESARNERNKTMPSPGLKVVTPSVDANEYAELKRLIKRQGLLEKQPAYYAYKTLLT
jgi:hypothetical protein